MERVAKKQNLPLLIVGGVVLVLFVVVVGSFISKQYAGDRELKRLQDELIKQEGVLNTQRQLLAEAKYRQEEFIEKAKQYLYLNDQSNIADIAKLIEQTATEYDIKLNSISEVKNQFKTDDGSSVLELAIVTSGCSYEKAVRFLAALRNMSPNLGWQHVQLAYNERLAEDARFVIAGTLRVVAINNEKIRELLGENIPQLALNIKPAKAETSEQAETEVSDEVSSEESKTIDDSVAEATEELKEGEGDEQESSSEESITPKTETEEAPLSSDKTEEKEEI